jgi:hypothetical protein
MFTGVAEPHPFDLVPDPEKLNDAAPAPNLFPCLRYFVIQTHTFGRGFGFSNRNYAAPCGSWRLMLTLMHRYL